MADESKITPVVLCGGNGTRLWPRSKPCAPKPFLRLVGDTTLFEEAIGRCAGEEFAPPVVVTGHKHRDLVEGQLPQGSECRLIIEPEGKNTAAAIALAAYRLPEDAVMLVCPSDHHIADVEAFRASAFQAAALAREGWLVAFGIVPTRPETGYGYIKQGEPLAGGYRVDKFVEKPDRARAEEFLAQGGYSWNGGIFAFRAGTFIEELSRHRPALANAVRKAVDSGREDGRRFLPGADAFAQIEGESVDYAVMEETDHAAMVPAAMGWSDIGNWSAVREAREHDAQGNVVNGRADLLDCRDVLVESDGPRVSLVGLENVIVVVDGDEILVTSSAGAASVGKLKGPAGG